MRELRHKRGAKAPLFLFKINHLVKMDKLIKEKLIDFFKSEDLKKSINKLSPILSLLEEKGMDSLLIGRIGCMVAANDDIDKNQIIDIIKKNNVEDLYSELVKLPYKIIPDIDIELFFEDDY